MSDLSRRNAALAVPPGAPTREELLAAYRREIRENRASRKSQHKVVILEDTRKRTPRLQLRQDPLRPTQLQRAPRLNKGIPKESPTRKTPGGQYLKKFLAGQFRLGSDDRPEGWAAAKINRAMRRYYRVNMLLSKRDEQHLALQNKLLFDECCRCNPLVPGPITTESGVLRLAEPNLPKILRILRNEANEGLDLLQPHGLAQYTALHVAAQRGYTAVVAELIAHWNDHPMNSRYQKYSFTQLNHLLELILEMRRAKKLVSEADAEMRALVADVGVSFARFSDSLDKLNDDAISLQDLLQICGHPLVIAKDAAGNTPLHYSAEGGHLTLSKMLIENGANINAQNRAGETPLHFAIASQRHGVCTYLVTHHADVRMSRYVSMTLLNGTVLKGNFVDSPDGKAMGKLMPSSNIRVGAMVQHKRSPQVKSHLPQYQTAAGPATVSPDHPLRRANARHDAVGALNDASCSTIDTLLASPYLCTRNRRDVVFFRPAPGYSPLPKVLSVLVISEHVTVSEINKAREAHQNSNLFNLLIQNVPPAAVIAMDSFRNPLFRCSMLKHAREHNQHWTVDSHLQTAEEKRAALITQMKGQARVNRSPKRRRRRGFFARTFGELLDLLRRLWKFLRRVRSVLSVQHVFAVADEDGAHNGKIVCEPKGILYEYLYDHAEFRGRGSSTMWLIIQTENKELIFHPWFRQLLDHKWNSFTRQTFRSQVHVYSAYFVAVFVATYLHVGDTLVGMPIGGYRGSILSSTASYPEYLRELARIVYTIINARYTFQEFQAYRECGSLRVYFRDSWNWFDLLQILCIWFLLGAELAAFIFPPFDSVEFELVAFQESLYSFSIQRRYNLRTTLMSIVGPLIFIKWIKFARGTRALGPFVRMIAKMLSDILVFVMVYCVFLGGFAFAFFILQLEGCKSYFTAVTTALNICLGSWDWDSIYEGGLLAIVLFVAFAVIGTIMLLNLLIAMMGNTYDKVWEDRLLFFEIERAKATLSIQTSIDDDVYDEKHWCQRLYVLEGDRPIEGIQFHRF